MQRGSPFFCRAPAGTAACTPGPWRTRRRSLAGLSQRTRQPAHAPLRCDGRPLHREKRHLPRPKHRLRLAVAGDSTSAHTTGGADNFLVFSQKIAFCFFQKKKEDVLLFFNKKRKKKGSVLLKTARKSQLSVSPFHLRCALRFHLLRGRRRRLLVGQTALLLALLSSLVALAAPSAALPGTRARGPSWAERKGTHRGHWRTLLLRSTISKKTAASRVKGLRPALEGSTKTQIVKKKINPKFMIEITEITEITEILI